MRPTLKLMKRRDLVPTLEAIYAVEQHEDDTAWLGSIIDVLPDLVAGSLGTNGLMYDLRTRPPKTWGLVNKGSPLESEILAAAVETSTGDYTREMAKAPVVAASEGPDFNRQPWLTQLFRPRGIEDVLTLNAFNPTGFGCSIVQPVPARFRLRRGEREHLARLSSHFAAACRLRWRLRASRESPDAVLSPDGKTLHAQNDAVLRQARDALKEATLAMERLRAGRTRANDATTLESWRPLVSAEWTLVDQFERDGKRYVVARANRVTEQGNEALTPRERQVVALSELGHHPKLIAYELGIAHSTVRVLLARAARRRTK